MTIHAKNILPVGSNCRKCKKMFPNNYLFIKRITVYRHLPIISWHDFKHSLMYKYK